MRLSSFGTGSRQFRGAGDARQRSGLAIGDCTAMAGPGSDRFLQGRPRGAATDSRQRCDAGPAALSHLPNGQTSVPSNGSHMPSHPDRTSPDLAGSPPVLPRLATMMNLSLLYATLQNATDETEAAQGACSSHMRSLFGMELELVRRTTQARTETPDWKALIAGDGVLQREITYRRHRDPRARGDRGREAQSRRTHREPPGLLGGLLSAQPCDPRRQA